MTMIEPGEKAPDFELLDQDGNEVSLSGLRGKTVVLYFYPKAATPGCTTQACGFETTGRTTRRLGRWCSVSRPIQSPKVKKFAEKYDLDFLLLADEDHAVAESYGVWVEKSMYGRKYMGNERTTFVIDPAGNVTTVLRKVKPSEHDELVLKGLRETSPPVV